MKIRRGFVSNSSSSNFIVAFAHKPKSVDDLKEMMFGKQEWHYPGIYGGGVTDISTQRIAEAVFKDLKGKRKATKKQMFESIRNGYFGSYLIPSLMPGIHKSDTTGLNWQDEEDREEIQRIWKESEEINDKRATAIAECFRKGHDDEWITTLNYADEEGSFDSILEHSGIFERLDYIITSCH